MATRRRFIRDCSALAASVALLPPCVIAAPQRGWAVSLADMPFATLAAQVHSRFVARDADEVAQSLELIEAGPAPGGGGVAAEEGGETFSLLFRGDADRPLGQDTYAFEHARIGCFEMFIVPIGREDGGQCHYEAVFNRPPPKLRGRSEPRRRTS